MEIEKSIVLIQFLLILRRSGDVLFLLYARRLRGYTATPAGPLYFGAACCFPAVPAVAGIFTCQRMHMNLRYRM